MLSSFRDLLNVGRKAEDSGGAKAAQATEEDAGAALLSHYRAHWERMHTANEENARQAALLAQQVAQLERRAAQDRRNAQLLVGLLTDSVGPSVRACVAQMDELTRCFKTIESDLLTLELAAEASEMERAKRANLDRLEKHRGRRRQALEELHTRLEAGHREAILRREERDKRRQEERRLVFQEAFRSDLEQYKILGAVPRPVAPADRAPSALLEEIQIDQDTSELDSFLDGEG